MKRLLPMLTLVALTLLATSASAQVNLRWDDCGATGVDLKTFGCNVNTGSYNLYGSFVPPTKLDSLAGSEIVIDLIAEGGALPAWWEFVQSGACRLTSLTANFITPCPAVDNGTAIDYWASIPGGPLGSFSYTYGATLCVGENCPSYGARADAARIKVVVAVDIAQADTVGAGTEVYACTVNLKREKSTGAGLCAGCGTAVCVVFNSCKVAQPAPYLTSVLTGGATTDSDRAWWQAKSISCASVPVRTTTWGQIKSLYR